jgi:hypothetical protein
MHFAGAADDRVDCPETEDTPGELGEELIVRHLGSDLRCQPLPGAPTVVAWNRRVDLYIGESKVIVDGSTRNTKNTGDTRCKTGSGRDENMSNMHMTKAQVETHLSTAAAATATAAAATAAATAATTAMTMSNVLKENVLAQVEMESIIAQVEMESIAQLELESNSISRPVRTAGVGCTKTDAQATYGLRFGRSTYRRKAKEISFPTQVVSCQNSLGVDANRQNKMTSRICQGAATPVFGPRGLVHPRVTRPPPWPPPSPLLLL